MSLLSIQLISKSACHGIEPLWLIDWLPATRTALWLIDWHLLVPEQPCVRLISSYLDSLVIDLLTASYQDSLVIDWLTSTENWTTLWLFSSYLDSLVIDWLIASYLDGLVIDWLPSTWTALWLIDDNYLDNILIDLFSAIWSALWLVDWFKASWTTLWLSVWFIENYMDSLVIDWLIDCLIDWQLPGQPCDWLTDWLTATWTAWMRWACWSRPSCSGHSWRRPLEYRELDCGHSVQINSTRTCVQHPCVQACTLQSIYIKLAQVKMRHMGAVGNSKTNLL